MGVHSSNAVAELAEPEHQANNIAVAFKEQRRVWFRDFLIRSGVVETEVSATQLALLLDGAIAAILVRGDPGMARAAREAAGVLLEQVSPDGRRALRTFRT